MRFKTFSRLLLLIPFFAIPLAAPAQAHDFWLAPETYNPAPQEKVDLSIMIGHPADRMMWPAAPHRIVAFRSVGPNGIQDHQSLIKPAAQSEALSLKFKAPGLHVLTIETTHAVSTLEADKFNAYLEEEGLTPIKLDRIVQGTSDEPGTEIYSRRGKALIQVGPSGEDDPDYLTKPLGLTLEIVPSAHPARAKVGSPMKAVIYYQGNPVKGVTIGLIDLKGDKGLVSVDETDRKGRVSFPRPNGGDWMLHAVWSAPLQGSDRADYDTVFSSLSFSLD
ncbi:MAG: DUF4198 domain-containing protein [Alphaproteobacteria bacterium]